jgi:hypothetical protein
LGGINATPDFHDRAFKSLPIFEDCTAQPKYQVVDATMLPPHIIRHVGLWAEMTTALSGLTDKQKNINSRGLRRLAELARGVSRSVKGSYRKAKLKAVCSVSSDVGINRCNITCISLEHGSDRSEIEKLGIAHHRRFNAIAAQQGALGCSLSHLAILRAGGNENRPLSMILEGDCFFQIGRRKLNHVIEEFFRSGADVLCLGFNATRFNEFPNGIYLQRVFDTQTTSCYIFKEHMRQSLIEAAELSVRMLQNGDPPSRAAFDIVLKQMQTQATFVASKGGVVIRRPSLRQIML